MKTLTDRLLRETIRQILREAAGPEKIDQLIEELVKFNESCDRLGVSLQAGVGADITNGSALIYYAVRDGRGEVIDTSGDQSGWLTLVEDNVTPRATMGPEEIVGQLAMPPWGSIEIGEPGDSRLGPCLGGWMVWLTAETKSGWGPLLYDLAIEVASWKAEGLMADRMSVTPDAAGVWQNYDTARGDIEKAQLDNIRAPETEVVEDDCLQISASEPPNKGAWKASPLSRLYRKSGAPAMDRLDNLGLMWHDMD